ncbi:cytochrome P450 [Lyophyllum atratum]|nr:cytochrome P450 [Lyophyllum atratum]
MYILLILSILVASVLFLRWHATRRAKMPPGPTHGFWGDNRKDVPTVHPWKTFTSWNQQYGSILVLGTAEAASDLLEKRSDIYSSRPRNIMANEILSGGMRGIGMPYGPRWRRWRSTVESSLLLRDLLKSKDPFEYRSHLLRFAMSTVFCMAYGRRIKGSQDDVVIANQKTDAYFIPTMTVQIERFLQWFRYEAERHRAMDTGLYMSLMNNVKEQMKLGTDQPSMATHALEKQEQFGLSDVETAFALSAPWAAGVGTTVSAIEVVILAMLHFPAVMRKAQVELDSVVGTQRLPGFDDYDSLPYLQALVKEVTRWRPIAPTGIPHSVTEDNTYNGMFIPKGSTVYANIQCSPNLTAFRPERFLDIQETKSHNSKLAFGFGRRVCPGMHIALQAMFITLSRLRMLWTFDILPVLENGKEVLPSVDDFTTGLVTRPANLRYRLVPRHKAL